MSKAEFKKWLAANHLILLKYNAFELAQLALHCGFSMADIAPDTSEWITASQRKLRLWESPFFERWLAMAIREKKGIDDCGEGD